MYEYRATVDRIVDADTLDLNISLGFGVHKKERIRLARVDAWEVRGDERIQGTKAKEFVEDILHAVNEVTITTMKDKKGKYGRYIAEVLIPYEGSNKNLGDLLIEKGHATEYGK